MSIKINRKYENVKSSKVKSSLEILDDAWAFRLSDNFVLKVFNLFHLLWGLITVYVHQVY